MRGRGESAVTSRCVTIRMLGVAVTFSVLVVLFSLLLASRTAPASARPLLAAGGVMRFASEGKEEGGGSEGESGEEAETPAELIEQPLGEKLRENEESEHGSEQEGEAAQPPSSEETPPAPPAPVEEEGLAPGFSLAAPFAKIETASERKAADSISRTAFAGIGPAAARTLAERTFHVNRPSFTAPGSEAGRKLVSYYGNRAATEQLPDGRRVVVNSTFPLRVSDAAGQLKPVSLELHQQQDTYLAQNPVVPIAISRTAGDGVTLPDGSHVAPTEVTGADSPTVSGNSVFWSAAARDTDYLVQPEPLGVDLSWILRSEHSAPQRSLAFQLAPEETLRLDKEHHGAVDVLENGQTVDFVEPPVASDASGRQLTAYYTLKGNLLTTHVATGQGVQYPVLVDPEIVVGYGGAGSGNWASWATYSTCGCYTFGTFNNVGRFVQPGSIPSGESYGEWYVNPGKGVLVTRVDIQGVYNFYNALNEDYFEAGAFGGGRFNGNGRGVYTENGYDPGSTRPAPIITNASFGGHDMAFCAWGTGTGYDGGAQPLCYEQEGSEGFAFMSYVPSSQNAAFADEGSAAVTSAEVRYITTYQPSVLVSGLLNSGWFNSTRAPLVRVTGTDKGFGITSAGLDAVPAGGQLPAAGGSPLPGFPTYAPGCSPPQCWLSLWTEHSISALTTGRWLLGGWAKSPAEAKENVYEAFVDNTPPVIEQPAWANSTVGEGPHDLTFTAHDGDVSAPQSGAAWAEIALDGVLKYKGKTACPEPAGIPSSGCYGISGTWTFQGENVAPGPHTVTLRVEDWAGNWSEAHYPITIARSADQTEQVGPGILNLQSGDYKLGATDVSIASGNSTLTVARSYDSRPATGTPVGSLGPGWTLSTPDTAASGQWQSLQVQQNGNVEVQTTDGTKALFEKSGSGYAAPAGFQNYTLTEPSTSPVTYQVTSVSGSFTKFEASAGSTVLMPTAVGQAAEAGGLNSVTYLLGEGKTQRIVGPEAKGVTCESKPTETRGCRVLTLRYATSTTATGDGSSEWGEYKGQLTSVAFTGWNPTTGAMSTVTVAQYAYDAHGRLRAEWDPRATTAHDCTTSEKTCAALKTTYGYDEEGHLVAISPPGQQPYILHYGSVAGSRLEGWLLGITRPGAETAIGTGSAPRNNTAPSLSSTSPVAGVVVKVSNPGGWSNSPLTYSYQWEQCNGPAASAP